MSLLPAAMAKMQKKYQKEYLFFTLNALQKKLEEWQMLNELPFLVGLLLSYFNKEPSMLSFLSASFFSKTFYVSCLYASVETDGICTAHSDTKI